MVGFVGVGENCLELVGVALNCWELLEVVGSLGLAGSLLGAASNCWGGAGHWIGSELLGVC